MKYLKETGALINMDGDLMHLFEGNAGSVNFDPQLIWDLHKNSPGTIYAICHTHPPGMIQPSSIDKEMLKGWVYALHPFPVRIIVIAEDDGYIVETCYFAQVESKESWLTRNKETPREFKMFLEFHNHYDPEEGFPPYIETLLDNSYEDDSNIIES